MQIIRIQVAQPVVLLCAYQVLAAAEVALALRFVPVIVMDTGAVKPAKHIPAPLYFDTFWYPVLGLLH